MIERGLVTLGWAVVGAVLGVVIRRGSVYLARKEGLEPVLVQVIFFDLEHRLILDRVMFPSMVLAVLLSQFTPHMNWLISLGTGLAAGLLFLLIAVAGAAIFKQEALGFGDVKLAAFMGLILGISPGEPPIILALFFGVLLAGVAGVAMMVLRIKALRDTFAYGPYLAAGAVLTLLALGAQ
jgi:leader peptidase (prepilin peptidase)/N-methyltransferase